MNKEIVINEENYEIYENLYKIKLTSLYSYENKKTKKFNGVVVTILAAAFCYAGSIYFINGYFLEGLLLSILVPCSLYSIALKNNRKQSINKFKKDYPDIDTDIDISELDNILKKYKNENIKHQEAKQTNYIKENINDMSLKEKYQVLKEEIDYIEQLETQEKYQNTDDLDNKVKNKNSLSKYRV